MKDNPFSNNESWLEFNISESDKFMMVLFEVCPPIGLFSLKI